MSGGNQSLSLPQEDAKRLETSYKLLYNLQRKNLTFLAALQDYEKRQKLGDGKSSRMAFIVTPLMVNHYNHMHHVYRASMYGKVPDLCDQTGGIMCADLAALREELATCTTDVNRSLTTTFRTATLPNVQFNFKAERDVVVESAVRMLDSIDIKQPDLTHSIRDDYIQNVRAIQESLTNALEQSRERSAELQSRLNETQRKLKSAEKIMASVPEDAERLRKEVFRLKEQIIKQQALVLQQRVEHDSNTLELKERESECNLLRELMKRIDDQSKGSGESLKALRADMQKYTEDEIGKLRVDYDRIRNELAEHVRDTIARAKKESEVNLELCRSLISQDGNNEVGLNEKLIKLQYDYHRLEAENAQLKRQAVRPEHTEPTILYENEKAPPVVDTECYSIDDSSNSCAPSTQSYAKSLQNDNVYALPEGDNEPMEYETIVYENVAREISEARDNAELATIIQGIVQQYNTLVNEYNQKVTNMEHDYNQKIVYLEGALVAHRTEIESLQGDLNSLQLFFTNPTNLDATLRLGDYLNKHGIDLKSNYGGFAKHLTQLSNDGLLYTEQSLHMENLNRTIRYSDEVVLELLRKIDTAYDDIAAMLDLERFPNTIVNPPELSEHFIRRFGKSLKDKVSTLLERNQRAVQIVEDLGKENAGLKVALDEHKRLDEVAQPPRREENERPRIVVPADELLTIFDGDPTIFEEILQKVWARHDTDRLHVLLDNAYYALALVRALRYETYVSPTTDLKLYNLVEYTVLTNHLSSNAKTPIRNEFVDPKLKEEGYFLRYFISQIGNIQVENYINTLDLNKRNQLALILFNDFYIPIVNKASYVMSIDGPFANFNMVYKT